MKKFLLLLTLLVSFGGMAHADTWIKVTSAADLSLDGEYIIVAQSGSKAMSTTFSNSYMGVTTDALTISDNKITDVPENIAVVSLEGASLSDCKVKISTLTGESKGYWTTSAAKKMKLTPNGTSASITYNSNYTQIKFSKYGTLYYNTASPRFLNYTSAQGKIDLFKKEALTGPQDYTPSFGDVTLEIGQTHQLELGDNHPEVLFISNNDNIATVDDATGLITAVAAGTTDITAAWDASNEWNEGETTFKVTVTKPLQDAGLAYSAAEATALLGEAFDAPVLSNPNNLAVTYTSSDEKVATINADGIVTIGGAGTTTIKATFAGNDEFRAAEASYTLTVTKPRPAGAIEEALLATTNFGVNGVTSQTYQDFTYTSPDTGIDYLAFLSGGASQEFFQIRTDKSQSGIVIKANKNGYVASSISIEWAPKTSDSRTLELYGKHKAYSAPSELFDKATQGTLLKKFAKTETEFNLNGEYNFIGLRSTTGVIYLSKITITWVPAAAPEVPVVEGFSEGTAMSVGDQITIKGKPGQHLHYIIETNAQFAMNRAAATEGWTPAESHEYTYTLATEDLPVKIRAKAVNGAGTHESEEVAFGIDSNNTPTGVEAIEAEDNEAEVEWFNLQGVRVENPAAGLYIRRQGNKVEKVVVK